MCTATWWHQPGGYTLFFNRDELKQRAEALPPQLFETDGVEYLSPTDPEGGGTWLAVNAHGLTLALVNHYPENDFVPTETDRRSRGTLVRELAGHSETLEVLATLGRLPESELRRYPPFYLLALGPNQPDALTTWNGETRTLREGRAVVQPITGSSFDSRRIVACRQAAFGDVFGAAEASLNDSALHRRYHHRHDPQRGAASVLMERPDARTVSYAEVRVTPQEVVLHYAPRRDADLAFGPASVHSLSRRTPAVALG